MNNTNDNKTSDLQESTNQTSSSAATPGAPEAAKNNTESTTTPVAPGLAEGTDTALTPETPQDSAQEPATPSDPAAQPVQSPPVESVLAADGAGSSSSTTLTEWPGAFKIFKIAKTAVLLNLKTFIFLILIGIGLEIISQTVSSSLTKMSTAAIAGLLSAIVSFVVSTFYQAATTYVNIESAKGNKVDFGVSFRYVFKRLINILIAAFIVGVLAMFSIILLIVPAFFIIPRIFMTLYYVIDKDLGPTEALTASWRNTKGNVGKVYGIFGVTILMILPALTIIGIPVTIYLLVMYWPAYAVLYNFITGQNSAPESTKALQT